jgi:hypothetical protein
LVFFGIAMARRGVKDNEERKRGAIGNRIVLEEGGHVTGLSPIE